MFSFPRSTIWLPLWGFPGGAGGKEPVCRCRRCKRRGVSPWVGKIPWRRAWQPTPLFLPGESHGQRSLVGYSPWGHRESDAAEAEHTCTHAHTHTHTHTSLLQPSHHVLPPWAGVSVSIRQLTGGVSECCLWLLSRNGSSSTTLTDSRYYVGSFGCFPFFSLLVLTSLIKLIHWLKFCHRQNSG